MNKSKNIVPIFEEKTLESMIYFIRGKKVMLDIELAELYEVDTGTLNRAVKRNIERFPIDFMFQLERKKITTL